MSAAGWRGGEEGGCGDRTRSRQPRGKRTLARRRAPALSRCAGEGLDARNHRRLTGGTENGNPVRKITMGKLSIITAAVIASCVAGCGDRAATTADTTPPPAAAETRSEEHPSELQSLLRIPYAVL